MFVCLGVAVCLQLTHLSQERKAACDASFRLGGQRGASQVLCNSAGGALAAAAAAAAAAWSGGSSSQQGQVLQLLAWSAFLVSALPAGGAVTAGRATNSSSCDHSLTVYGKEVLCVVSSCGSNSKSQA